MHEGIADALYVNPLFNLYSVVRGGFRRGASKRQTLGSFYHMKTADIIKHYGSSKAMAEALGVSPAAVSQWGEFPPPLRQLQIQKITRGRFKATKQAAPWN